MQWTDKAAERLICKNVPIDNLHCKSGLPAEILALSCLLIHLPYLEASRATTCFWPKFRVRLGKTIIVVAIFWLKQELIKSADLCSDIVSKLVKVTIGNMLVITSGSKVVKERTNGNKILRSVELV